MIVSHPKPEPCSLSSDEQMLLVYADLRSLARRYVRRDKAGVTLGATGLVHEAWIKIRRTLGDDSARTFSDREYYAILAQAMRRILIDRARKKRGGCRVADWFAYCFTKTRPQCQPMTTISSPSARRSIVSKPNRRSTPKS